MAALNSDERSKLQRGTSALVIAQAIRTEIEGGRLRHGQQLAGTRALAEDWGTSVATITRAMQMLGEQGLVVSRDRSHRVVNYPQSADDTAAVAAKNVVLIGGYAGSGKTELGRIIARQTGWPILDKDTTTRQVVEAALESLGLSRNDRESDQYVNVIRPAEYNALLETMTENVQCGNSAVVTAPFIRELQDRAWCDRQLASIQSMGAHLHVAWVRCDEQTMRTYLQHRGAARDTAKLEDWTRYMAGVDLAYKPQIEHRIVDNSAGSRPLQEQAAELLTALHTAP